MRNGRFEKESLKRGIGVIFLQMVFWGMDMLGCENTEQLYDVMCVGGVMLILMIACAIFMNITECCKGKQGVQGGLLFLMMALSTGINKGIVANSVLEYVLCWAIGVTGTVLFWEFRKRRHDKKQAKYAKREKNGSIKPISKIGAIPTVIVPAGGIWGARWLMKSVGQQKAYWIYIGAGIFLEIFLAIIGVSLIMVDIYRCREE